MEFEKYQEAYDKNVGSVSYPLGSNSAMCIRVRVCLIKQKNL